MAMSVTQMSSDLSWKALVPSNNRKESLPSSKKKDSKRSSQHKSKAKSRKTEDNDSSHPKKSPFSCNCENREWDFDETGHPFCRTCNPKSTALKTVDPNSSDPRMSAMAEGKRGVSSTVDKPLRDCPPQSPSPDTARSNSKLQNLNTIQALLEGLALEQQYAGFSSSDASAKSTLGKKHRNESSESVVGQGLRGSIQDPHHYRTPVKSEPTSRSEIYPMREALICITGASEEIANTQPSPKPIMRLRSKPGSAQIRTPSRRVSFEESSTSEAIMTPTTGSSATLSGDESDCESSSDNSDASDSDLNPHHQHGVDISLSRDVAQCAARKLALNSSNPYKAILEDKYSRQPFAAAEFNLRVASRGHAHGIQTHGNGEGNEHSGSTARHHGRSSENRSISTQKRRVSIRGPRDDDDDEERRGQRRGPKAPRDSSPPPERRLACPFFQRDPERTPKAGSCVQHGFKSISTLKFDADYPPTREHLYRTHENPILCPRCYQPVIETDFGTHVRACREVLPEEQHPILDGFDKVQRAKISDKMRGKTPEEKWRAIYQILFPDDPDDKIPSPYWTDQVILRKKEAQKSLKSYETFIRQELSLRLRRRMQEDVAINSNTEFLNGIVGIATDVLNETMAAYWRGEAASGNTQATETRPHARATRATPGPSQPSNLANRAAHSSDPAPQNSANACWNPFVPEPSPQVFASTIHHRGSNSSLRFPEPSRAASASVSRQHRQHTHLLRRQSSIIPSANRQPCDIPPRLGFSANNDTSAFQPLDWQSQDSELAALSEEFPWCYSTDGGSEMY